jgi:hypothetical protein
MRTSAMKLNCFAAPDDRLLITHRGNQAQRIAQPVERCDDIRHGNESASTSNAI